MKFQFSRYGLSPEENRLERFFQILPGFTSWIILLGFSALSFARPLWAAALIILFDFYWLLRLFYLVLFLLISYLRLSMEKETNWMKRVHEIDRFLKNPVYSPSLNPSPWSLKKLVSESIFRKEFEDFKKSGSIPPSSDEIFHLVIIPVAKEAQEVVEPGILSLGESEFPSKKIFVILAVEDRAPEAVKRGALNLEKKYGKRFRDFQVIFHPDGVAGEARVKGANVTHAARRAAKCFKDQAIAFEHVIVSCFDADTVVTPTYFACLTYYFMVSPRRYQASFQPIPVYHNNIWEAAGFARVLEMGSSFFQLAESTNQEKLVTFSSHSMSFKALVDVNYWPVDMISDDSAIFWKAFIHFEGDYRVIPMYVTLSMDVVNAGTWWKTIVNVYKQKRRWAWGVENFPIVMRAFLKSDRISIYDKIRYGFKLYEMHVAWATWPFLLAVCGWLPALFAGREFSDSVLYYSAPRITSIIFDLASVSLFITIILSLFLLPRRKVRYSFLRRAVHAFEWLLIPLIAVFFSGLPALDAQTRLMLGKYMEFWVTEKNRKK